MNRHKRRLEAIKQAQREHVDSYKAVWKKADEEDREPSDEERLEVEGHMKAIEDLNGEKAEVEATLDTLQKVKDVESSLGPAFQEPEKPKEYARPKRPMTFGEQFVQSDGYKSIKAKAFTGRWTTGQVELQSKATLLEGANWDAEAGTPGAGAPLVSIDQQGGIVAKLFDPNVVANLPAQGTTDSNSVRYVVETTATSGATGVAEGGVKPESTLVFDQVDESVKKIATSITVSDEMLEDASQIQSYLNARLSLFVRNEENDQLLNATGAGNDLNGLLNRVPVGNQDLASGATAANPADNIYEAITKIRVGGFMEPDGIVIHPEDWAFLRLTKDQNENYIGGSPFSNTGSNPGESLWGKRVVITQAIAAGTALVGAFSEASQIFRKGGLTVEATNSHADNFTHDLTVVRAEVRLALAVYRPSSFATADLYAS